MTRAGGHFSKVGEDCSEQRTLCGKRDNSADLRRKAFSRTGKDPEA